MKKLYLFIFFYILPLLIFGQKAETVRFSWLLLPMTKEKIEAKTFQIEIDWDYEKKYSFQDKCKERIHFYYPYELVEEKVDYTKPSKYKYRDILIVDVKEKYFNGISLGNLKRVEKEGDVIMRLLFSRVCISKAEEYKRRHEGGGYEIVFFGKNFDFSMKAVLQIEKQGKTLFERPIFSGEEVFSTTYPESEVNARFAQQIRGISVPHSYCLNQITPFLFTKISLELAGCDIFPFQAERTENFYVFEGKKHDYSQLNALYNSMNQYANQRSTQEAKNFFTESLKTYEKELANINLEDKKAKFHEKNAGYFYHNASLIALWAENFTEAKKYAEKATAFKKTEKEARSLLSFIKGAESRFLFHQN